MKYIDTDKLIAEIERWRDKAKKKYNESTYSMGRCDALAEFRNHIVSLQQDQPEVDLEKEIKDWCNENITGVRPIYTADSLIYALLPKTARHFYELGLKAAR